jgi:hypothetical protein
MGRGGEDRGGKDRGGDDRGGEAGGGDGEGRVDHCEDNASGVDADRGRPLQQCRLFPADSLPLTHSQPSQDLVLALRRDSHF